MHNALSLDQLLEWEAYNELDPIGEWRGDFRMASVMHIIVNAFRSAYGKKSVKMSKVEDYMPDWEKPYRNSEVYKQPLEEMKNVLTSIFKSNKNRKT